MGRLSEYSEEEQRTINGGTVAVPVHELQEIDRVLVRAMDALVAGEVEIEACYRAVLYCRDIETEWAEGSTVIEAFDRLMHKCKAGAC